jgi:signal peptidase I
VDVIRTEVKPSLLPAILSALLPGLGDFILPQKTRGTTVRGSAFLAAVISIAALYFIGGFYRYYWAYWFFRCTLFLNIGSAILTCSSLFRRANATRLTAVILVALIFGWASTALSLYVYGIRIYGVPSTGFQPTIVKDERIFCDTSAHSRERLKPGDVVVLRYRGITYVKRLIALGGDEVMSIEGHIAVNGKALNIPAFMNGEESDQAPRNFGPVTVPRHQCFVIGDNRDFSLDTRNAEFGFPPVSALYGKVLYVFGPANASRLGIPIK